MSTHLHVYMSVKKARTSSKAHTTTYDNTPKQTEILHQIHPKASNSISVKLLRSIEEAELSEWVA